MTGPDHPWVPATREPCAVCDHGYTLSGGPAGMLQRCDCCRGRGWHDDRCPSETNPREAA